MRATDCVSMENKKIYVRQNSQLVSAACLCGCDNENIANIEYQITACCCETGKQINHMCAKHYISKVKGPRSELCQLNKPFSGPRLRHGSCQDEQKRKVFP